jgi:hypothetical protein
MKAINPDATKISFIIVFGLIASDELIFKVSKLEK